MTTGKAPTIDEQIDAQKEVIEIHKKEGWHEAEIEMDEVILESLEELKRIKQDKKPDVVKLYYKEDKIFMECSNGEGCIDKHDLRCTFDGETGELKSAEVIK